MKYILDTNICIAILKGISRSIIQKCKSIENNDVFIPSIVRYELFYGVEKSNRKEETLLKLNEFLSIFMI